MPLPTFFPNGQDYSYNETALVALNHIEVNYTDDAAAMRWFPLITDVDGNLFVTLGGPGGGPIGIPDDADDVPEVATDSRIPTVARLYGLDSATNSDWDRLRTDDDALNASDAESLPALRTMNRPRIYSQTNNQWLRVHANDAITVLASAARTATNSSAILLNGNHRGGHFIIDVTAITATPSVVFSIEARDAGSLNWYSLLDSVAIVGVGTTILRVYPGLFPVTANLVANDILPFLWRVTATHADADSITYSVGANLEL